MRTNNFFSIAALVICGLVCFSNVKASTPAGGTSIATSDPVTVNIKFKPIQSIVVNSSQKTVDLEYITKDDYANGVSVTKDDHLEVFSTGGFIVSVASNGDFMESDNAETSKIDAAEVTIVAKNGSETNNGQFEQVTLSTAPTQLISSNTGGTKLNYSITYNNQAGANNKYINKYMHNDVETVYTAEVTYTIATK